MINKNNIEEKLFDYFEGELTNSEKTELEQFVDKNPDYKTDFDAWEKSYLPQEEFTYDRVDELLVNEKTGKSALFGRWKAGLLMLLVGTGLSFGLFQKLNDGTKESVADTEAKDAQDTKQTKDEAVYGNNSNEVIADNEKVVDDKMKNVVSVNTTTINTSPQNSSSNSSGGQNNAQTGGKINLNNALARGNQTTAALNPTIKNTSVVNSLTANTVLKNALAENSSYTNIKIGLETSSVAELLSTPRIKKVRSKFQKYDKNELKFQNEKDPFFVLPNGVGLAMNPSFAGNGKGLRLNYNYNYEWPELNDNYNTHTLSLDSYVKALRGGVGVVVTSDVLGHNKFSTKGAELIYSPKFILFGKTTVEPAVKYGHYQKNVAWSQIKTGQLVDSRTGVLNVKSDANGDQQSTSSASYSNLGFGLLLNTSKLFVGFAYDHLLGANYDFDGISDNIKVPGKLTAQVGGSLVPIKDMEFLILSPSLHFIKVGGYDKVWLSNVVELSRLFIGTSYSFNNEYLLSLGYDNDILRVSYSYGQTKSMVDQLAKNLSLHQVGLVFNFMPNKR
ncbi:MAG: type IX secretion system PorP/SprF family membrane protein [Glaciecola sp.]|jgi:type IX secretion system PorP/SprF family membrane protein